MKGTSTSNLRFYRYSNLSTYQSIIKVLDFCLDNWTTIITQFYNEGLTFDQEKLNNSSQIWTSINTDDQGVFDIKLENEYALIARALERKIDENGNPVYSKTMIYNWLDKIRKMGLEQSFLISQMSVYGETSMEKEIQNRENKGYKRLWKN